jgi:hypothetical protein
VSREEGRLAVSAACRPRGRGGGAVGITTSLEGAGGFGKTTLAAYVGAHPRVRRRFRGRVYTVTIGRDVRGRCSEDESAQLGAVLGGQVRPGAVGAGDA